MNLQSYLGEATPRRKVYLHGYLGELFGKEFDLAVRSPVEAIRLLEANFPRKFQAAVKKGVFQIVVAGVKAGVQCSLEMCHFLFPKGSIHIIPIPEGSGGGGGKSKGIILSIIGVALIATAFIGAAFLAGGVGIGAGLGTAAFAGVTWGQIGLLGAALLLLGVSILLTPTPKPKTEGPEVFQSFFYSGAINSEKEGVPVPIVYGRVFAGSIVIAGGIFDDELAITSNPPVGSALNNGSDFDAPFIREGDPNSIDNDINILDNTVGQFNLPVTYTRGDETSSTGSLGRWNSFGRRS